MPASDPGAALARLRALFSEVDSVLVAFSGGTDSTLVLRVAHDVLGRRCIALTTRSPSTPAHDRAAAEELAREIGVEHVWIDTNELADPRYAANPVNRCYFCKTNLFDICERERARRGLTVVMDGANVDDLADHRPGLEAAARHGVRHPLVEAGLTKAAVRAASRLLGLRTWDRPASPCLSSRVPYGTPINAAVLARIDTAEQYLRSLGFRELRVRAHDTLARIEVGVDELPRLVDDAVRAGVTERLRALGFVHVTVDLRGFRSGSLNEGIVETTRGPEDDPRAPRVR
ncbi:MAG TPA: ATP-dependent sacrificial sulfur transferase LarE [Candidatus Limnocylindria bacterium]|nr:ATP-dependent sacrificial sulfur transferase LarE [Candidatus Limnocylindria bacterium]